MNSLPHTKGALVYIPAGARLYQFGRNDTVTRYRDMPKPTGVLFVESIRGFCEIIYGGERWNVKTKDIYPMRIENEQR
jgi:hypothetical protein